MKRSGWLICLALGIGLSMIACAVPLPASNASQPPRSVAAVHGIDPALPHAKAVLMQTCTEPGCNLRLLDPATGAPLPGYAAVDLGKYANVATTFNGKTLATLVYPSNLFTPRGGPTDGRLQLIDLQTWHVITTTLTFNEGGGSPAFSPDGTQLALIGFHYIWPPAPLLHLVDVVRQTELARIPLEFRPTHLKFSADGQSILLYGNTMGVGAVTVNPQVYVAQVRVPDLVVEWQVVLPDQQDGLYNSAGKEPHTTPESSFAWQPAVVFAPVASLLYIVHADKNELTTVDFDQHKVQTAPIGQAQSWLERLLALTARTAKAKVFNGTSKQAVIAPDGRTLYVTGFRGDFNGGTYVETPLGIQVIDLASGTVVAQIDSAARTLSLAADGARLYVHGWRDDPTQQTTVEWTEVIDTTTYEPVAKLDGRAIAVGQRLDGQPILFSITTRQDGQWEATTLDPASLAVLHTWTEEQPGQWSWFVTE